MLKQSKQYDQPFQIMHILLVKSCTLDPGAAEQACASKNELENDFPNRTMCTTQPL